MTTREISRLIAAAGRQPIERDTFYNVIRAGHDLNVHASHPAAP
jgi:2-iminoacetate synthase ThiH